MARPPEFDRDVVLERAMEVFWEKGYEAASLQDLIDAMDLSKSSFYQAFRSKHDLFAVTLDHYTDCLSTKLANDLAVSDSGLGFIERTFLGVVESARQKTGLKGCFLINTASEFGQANDEIAELTLSGLRKMERVFTRALVKAQQDGEIPTTKDPKALASYLVSNMSGIKTMVKAGIKPSVLRPIVSTIIASLK